LRRIEAEAVYVYNVAIPEIMSSQLSKNLIPIPNTQIPMTEIRH